MTQTYRISAHPPVAVKWSVIGGGTINDQGVFTAPESIPPGGTVTILATSMMDNGLMAEAIAIVTAPPLVSPYRHIVFVDPVDGRVKAQDGTTGAIAFTGATLDDVLTPVLAIRGDIYVKGGDYVLGSTSSGFNVNNLRSSAAEQPLEKSLILAADARIQVPSGFEGTVFTIRGSFVHLSGGSLSEVGPSKQKWTGVKLLGQGGSAGWNGTYWNTVERLHIANAGVGVAFESSDANGWVNGNVVQQIKIILTVTGLDFTMSAPSGSNNGFQYNTIRDLEWQPDGATAKCGICNVQGVHQQFINVMLWDAHLVANGHSMTITSAARDTTIIGGYVSTPPDYLDEGINTRKLP